MNNIKIILLCSSRFAIPAIREFTFLNILGAVAIPKICSELIEHVNLLLTGTNIPIIELDENTFSQRLKEAIEENEANLGLMISFPYKITSDVYTLPAKGFYNVHPGPLPQYRGPDPVFEQLKNNEPRAGVTIHKVDDGIDKGPLVMGEMIQIEAIDTYGILTTKLSYLAAKLCNTLIKLISLDLSITTRPQDEAKARYFKKAKAKDIMINWQTMDADTILALIKACNPWNKGAVTNFNNQIIRLLDAEKITACSVANLIPGQIISTEEKGIIVSTINGGPLMVKTIYTEEGFLNVNYLHKLGIVAGKKFV